MGELILPVQITEEAKLSFLVCLWWLLLCPLLSNHFWEPLILFVGPRGIRHYVNTQLHVCLSLSNFSVNDTSSAVEQHLGNEWGAAMVWRPCHCQAPVYCPQKVVVDVEGSSLQEKANVAPIWWKARRVPHGESGESVLVEKKWTMRQLSPPFKGRIY